MSIFERVSGVGGLKREDLNEPSIRVFTRQFVSTMLVPEKSIILALGFFTYG